ncbi:MAG: hypothetical protein OXU33_12880 [Gemmatimonadota bacterium]|nr:hypothetical protein [Gemmatimonadota bacterium]MDE3004518.1 hypothetical protein [Gemmatimonadota bacterium]MDE3014957.1 hypothetical protein [Gemmatimonadota bacterium]
MSSVRMRPTFRVRVRVSADRDAAIDRIREILESDERFVGRWRGKGRWAEVYVSHGGRKLWSPHLSIRLDEEPDGCTLFGRFAPHPEAWTFFMFLYFAFVFGVVFGGVLGYVQWASNEPAWGLWAVSIGVPAIVVIHVAGWIGQHLGYDQIVSLKDEIDEVLTATGLALESGAS